MNNSLTERMKISFLPLLLKRDGGFFCFYCKCDLSKTDHVFEHLDDDRTNNEIDNTVLACISCNNKKPSSPEMKKRALEKKKLNEQSNSSREYVSDREKRITTSMRRLEAPAPSFKPELDISEINFEIAEQFLHEKLSVGDEMEFKTAVDSITMICRNKTGTGSQPAVRRYLDALVSPEGKFMVVQNSEKKKVIVMRYGQ